jgi:NADPH:quinone reductase-like Zn-dependent oxidoreductase
MATTGLAAWIREVNQPFPVEQSEKGKPGPKEVLVRNKAVAVNPVDWMQQYGPYPPGKLPRVLGNDVAGEIVEVGAEVTLLRVGQRVMGHCTALNTDEARHGGFQEYTVVPELGCAPIPDDMEFKDAAVLPLGLSTAALGLFQPELLSLRLPGASGGAGTGEKKEAVVIWGGSSSVGSCAIQLARAAGYAVVTTSSPRNFALCKDLGAQEVFDHSSPGIVDELVKAMKGYTCVGGLDGASRMFLFWLAVARK